MQTVFHHSNPNEIAEIIMDTLNQIIDTLAPMRIVPIKKDYIPYIDSDTRKLVSENKRQLSEAISAKNDKAKWRIFRRQRNRINKLISKQKSDYIKQRLRRPIDKWKFIKSINLNQASSTPSHITLNGYTFQSPRIISNMMNDFYINKINDIRSGFRKPQIDPISVLKKFRPDVKTTLKCH